MKKLFAGKNKSKKEPTYLRRAPLIALLIFAIFVVEIFALVLNSSISAGGNEEVAAYKAEVEDAQNKKKVVMGNIYDRKGTELVTFSDVLANDQGTYADASVYSSVLGYCRPGDSKGLLGKYESILRSVSSEKDEKGNSLHLTLDHELQEKVYDELSARIGKSGRGSMVVMDAETGEVLAMVAMPLYDASDISNEMEWMNDPEKNNGVWYPLTMNKVIAPGSTFKLISSLVMLENGMKNFVTNDDLFYEGNGYTIKNYSSYYSNGEIGLSEALRRSSNVYFVKALVPMEGAKEKLTEKANQLWLGTSLELDFGTVKSSFTYNEKTWEEVLKKKYFNEERELATTVFGQSETRMTSTQGAMLAAGIVNGGKIMVPYMVEDVVNCNGRSIDWEKMIENNEDGVNGITLPVASKGTILSTLTGKKYADTLLSMMREAAIRQYGFDESLKVAAKSGTSETGDSGDAGNNAWMVSSAEFGGHKYAIAINWANANPGVQGKDMKVPIENVYKFIRSRQS